jgi:hypothetical protein
MDGSDIGQLMQRDGRRASAHDNAAAPAGVARGKALFVSQIIADEHRARSSEGGLA